MKRWNRLIDKIRNTSSSPSKQGNKNLLSTPSKRTCSEYGPGGESSPETPTKRRRQQKVLIVDDIDQAGSNGVESGVDVSNCQ